MWYVRIIILFLCAITLAFSIYFLIRNRKVYDFRINIYHSLYDSIINYLRGFTTDEEFADHINEYYELSNKVDAIKAKYSYDQMLCSFKPLKLENWYSEEEIKFIK